MINIKIKLLVCITLIFSCILVVPVLAAPTPIGELKFNVVDELKDEADLGNGQKAAKIYSTPRQIFIDKGVKKARPTGWNKFNENTVSKFKSQAKNGYDFSIPLSGRDIVNITSGGLEKKNGNKPVGIASPAKPLFSQKLDINNHTLTSFQNVYDNVSVNFIDKQNSRTKEIVIENVPSDINNDSEVIFWENYSVPVGAKVMVGDSEYSGEIRTFMPTTIVSSDQSSLLIDASIVYDSKSDDDSYCDMSRLPVEQIVSYDTGSHMLTIGLVVKGAYLLDSNRVYPVIIDPSYYTCTGTSCVTDFYFDYLTGKSTLTYSYLFIGYDYASGVSPCTPVGYASRHGVFKFDVSGIQAGSTITDSKLNLYYTGIGCGEYNTTINLLPKKITSAWTYSSATYNTVRPNLTTGGTAKGLGYNTLSTDCPGGICTWDLYDSMVKGWVDNSASNYGFLIEPVDNFTNGSVPPTSWTNQQRLFKFYSSDYGSATSPYLYVTYSPPISIDLSIYSDSLSKTAVLPGESITAYVRVKNNLTGTAAASTVGYYYSTDSTCTTGDTLLATDSVESLGASAISVEDNASITIPSNAVSGIRYICLIADINGVVSESNETNNTASVAITVTVPDLIVFTKSISTTSVAPNDTITAYVRVQNTGTGTAPASTVGYYFSTDSTCNTSDTQLATDSVESLTASSASVEDNAIITIPSNATAGTRYICFIADNSGVISESNESNNTDYVSITVTVNPYEPNNTYLTAYNIGTVTSFSAPNLTLTASDQDWFKFTYNSKVYYFNITGFGGATGDYGLNFIRSGSFVTIETVSSNSSNVDTYLDLYDSDGTTKLAYNDDDGVNNFSLISNFNLNPTYDFYPTQGNIRSTGELNASGQIEYEFNLQNLGSATASNMSYRSALYNISTGQTYGLLSESPATWSLAGGASGLKIMTATIDDCSMPYDGYYQVVIELNDNDAYPELSTSNNINYTSDNIRIRRTNTCSGGGGGGGGYVTQLDYDNDRYFDAEEFYAGTNVSGVDPHPIYDTAYTNYAAKVTDWMLGNYDADPVNVRTGGFEFTQTDFSLSGRAGGIDFTRTYNSKLFDRNNRLGQGWSHSYNIYYYQTSTKHIQLYKGGAQTSIYTTSDSGQTFLPPAGESDELYWLNNIKDGTLIYRKLDGTKYYFSPVTDSITPNLGILKFVVDTNNNTTTFNYTSVRSMPLLSSVVDASGRSIYFTYGSSSDDLRWDKIAEIRDGVNPSNPVIITYTYDGSENLILVQSNRIYNGASETIIKNFEYTADGKMTTYTDPRGTILYNTFDGEGRVTEQWEYNPNVDAVGAKRKVYALAYTGANANAPGSTHCTNVKSYRNASTYYEETSCFNAGELKNYQANGLNQAQYWQYDASGMPMVFVNANGATTTYTYDSKRRLTKEVLPDANGYYTEKTYAYENAFNRMISSAVMTQKNGVSVTQTTTYSIDSGNGNVLSVTDPMGYSESFTYNSGNIISKTEKNGVSTALTYDANKNYILSETVGDVANSYVYDVYGHRTRYTDPKGNVYNYEYDTKGNLRKVINPDNSYQTFGYDLEDHMILSTDELGRVTTYNYDKDINASLLSVTKSGVAQSSQYDWVGNKLKDIDALGRETVYFYDSANRLITKQLPSGSVITYTYDGNGNLLTEENSVGQKTVYIYDARNEKIATRRYTDATNYISTQQQYDGLGRVISVIDAKGNISSSTYDLNNHVLSIVDPVGNIESYQYDHSGNKTRYTDKLGRQTNYTYDSLNRLTTETNPDQKVSVWTYDKNSNLIKAVDRQNSDGTLSSHIATFAYNNHNQLVGEGDAYGNTTTYTYDAVGNKLTKTDPIGRTWTFVYDNFNRVSQEKDPGNVATNYTYDAVGNKLSVTTADGSITGYSYNSLNLVTAITDDLGNARHYSYDTAGQKLSETDKRGYSTSYTYDKLGRILTEINPQGTVTTYSYDNNSNRLSQSVAGKATAFAYDTLNRVVSVTYPGSRVESYSYNVVGNKISATDGKGDITTFVYDSLNRLTAKAIPGQASTTYSYDNWNNTISLNDASGNTSYIYDNKNRNLSETRSYIGLQSPYTISRSYFADDKLKSLTDAGGKIVNYNYDNRGLLSTVVDGGNTLATYTYSSVGLPQTLSYGNGVNTNYTYDDLHRIATQEIVSGTTSLFKHEYTYDTESDRSSVKENNGRTISYSYDDLGQLIGVDYSNITGTNDISYTYDAWGNRTVVSSTAGNTNYLFSVNTNELSKYSNNALTVDLVNDGNGSLSSESYSKAGQNILTANYAWDKQKRLTGINYHYDDPLLPGRADNNLSFVYDDFGNRVKKTVNGTSVYYVNNGLTVINEMNSAGGVTKSVVYGLAPIAEFTASGTIQYIHNDVLGSTVLVTANNGRVVASYEYEPFGATTGYQGVYDTNYLFTGQEFDPESELYYYNARYYNPQTGRFIARDPQIGIDGDSLSKNEYIYVKNNPNKYNDPSGEFFDIFVDAVSAIVDIGQTAYGVSQYIYGQVTDNETYIERGKDNLVEGGLSLLADAGSAFIPFFSGGGVMVRAALRADDVIDAVRVVDKSIDSLKSADRVGDSVKALDKFDDATDMTKATKRWKVGDPVNTPTKNGYPTWDTSRSRYWKNEAATNPDLYSVKKLEIMKKGRAPLDVTGNSMELHHLKGRNIPDPHNPNNLLPMSKNEHIDFHKQNGYTNFVQGNSNGSYVAIPFGFGVTAGGSLIVIDNK